MHLSKTRNDIVYYNYASLFGQAAKGTYNQFSDIQFHSGCFSLLFLNNKKWHRLLLILYNLLNTYNQLTNTLR